jgi:hypothetical protein
MEKNTKILLGLAAIGIVAYLIYKNKSKVTVTAPTKLPGDITPTTQNTRQQNINNMFSTTDVDGVIKNPYSGNNNSKFDDYVIGNKVTQDEIEAAKKAFPNAPLTKSNYLVANAKKSIFTTSPCNCITYPCNCGSLPEISYYGGHGYL